MVCELVWCVHARGRARLESPHGKTGLIIHHMGESILVHRSLGLEMQHPNPCRRFQGQCTYYGWMYLPRHSLPAPGTTVQTPFSLTILTSLYLPPSAVRTPPSHHGTSLHTQHDTARHGTTRPSCGAKHREVHHTHIRFAFSPSQHPISLASAGLHAVPLLCVPGLARPGRPGPSVFFEGGGVRGTGGWRGEETFF